MRLNLAGDSGSIELEDELERQEEKDWAARQADSADGTDGAGGSGSGSKDDAIDLDDLEAAESKKHDALLSNLVVHYNLEETLDAAVAQVY
jgi:hypothetical protein